MIANDANTYLPGTIQTPSSLLLDAATQSYPMLITISVQAAKASNTYIPGMLVTFFVPKSYGMFQLNGMKGKILSVTGNDFLIDIDSVLFDPFVVPSGNVAMPASISPSGSLNLEFSNTTNQVPFQSLNNIGN